MASFGSFGKGAFGVLVTWKQNSSQGQRQQTLYRYQTEEERNKKLKSFRVNRKVQTAEAVSGYLS